MTAQPPVYTLKDCLEQGLLNNYSLRITRNQERVSENNATLANAGALPTLDLSAGYSGTLGDTETKLRATGATSKENGAFDQTLDAGINLEWTVFDGFNITATYQQLKELERQGKTDTRIALEDLIANIAAEYYNFVQQKIRLKNFHYAMTLSRERVRIAEARVHVGNASRLDYLQARVDFNADSAQYIKQQEALHTSRIELNELMSNEDVDEFFLIRDSLIDINHILRFDELQIVARDIVGIGRIDADVKGSGLREVCPEGVAALFDEFHLSDGLFAGESASGRRIKIVEGNSRRHRIDCTYTAVSAVRDVSVFGLVDRDDESSLSRNVYFALKETYVGILFREFGLLSVDKYGC